MKRVTYISYIFVAMLFQQGIGWAEKLSLSGENLYKLCSSNKPDEIATCNSYILGVLDGRLTYMWERVEVDGKSPPLGLCIYEKQVTIEELRSAVVEQISADEEKYAKTWGGYAIIKAIQSKFPCRH